MSAKREFSSVQHKWQGRFGPTAQDRSQDVKVELAAPDDHA
jgi:hypothetical protein